MKDLSDPIDEVRVVPATHRPTEVEVRPDRSPAEQIRDQILDTAETKLREARDALVEAVEMMEVVMVPQHQHLDRLLGQMIEQVLEYRRVHR